MRLYKNLNQVITMKSAHEKDGRNLKAEDLSIIKNASVVFDNEKILWVGGDEFLPEEYQELEGISLEGHILTNKFLLEGLGKRSFFLLYLTSCEVFYCREIILLEHRLLL